MLPKYPEESKHEGWGDGNSWDWRGQKIYASMNVYLNNLLFVSSTSFLFKKQINKDLVWNQYLPSCHLSFSVWVTWAWQSLSKVLTSHLWNPYILTASCSFGHFFILAVTVVDGFISPHLSLYFQANTSSMKWSSYYKSSWWVLNELYMLIA